MFILSFTVLKGRYFKKTKGRRMMCVKPSNPEKEKSAIAGMSVELLNVID